MKQTAVEWLVNEANLLENNGWILPLIEQAKEMEKQQIIDAGNSCALKQAIHNRKLDLMSLEQLEEFALEEEAITFGEEYYNETFK
jgi:hypothetical protein